MLLLLVGSAASPPMHPPSAKDTRGLSPVGHWQDAGFPTLYCHASEVYLVLVARIVLYTPLCSFDRGNCSDCDHAGKVCPKDARPLRVHLESNPLRGDI